MVDVSAATSLTADDDGEKHCLISVFSDVIYVSLWIHLLKINKSGLQRKKTGQTTATFDIYFQVKR